MSEEQELTQEVLQQQCKYLSSHIDSLKSLIQDKDSIIENLHLRYDLGIIDQDSNRIDCAFSADEVESMEEELKTKAEALAQRTILENFELRDMRDELQEENFNLRTEIYELQDKINHNKLCIVTLQNYRKIVIGHIREVSKEWSMNIPKEITQNIYCFVDKLSDVNDKNPLTKIQVDDEDINNDETESNVDENAEDQTKDTKEDNNPDTDSAIDQQPQAEQSIDLGSGGTIEDRAKLLNELESLRSQIQDKENVIENLMLRYDYPATATIGINQSPDEEMEDLRRRAEALAQRTVLENFELREMINEMRDENFHLKNEIYEMVCHYFCPL